MTSVAEALAGAGARLPHSDTPVLDAELLLAHVLGRRRTWLRAWPEVRVETPKLQRFEELVARRAVGEPIAYLIGRREFHSLEIEVTPEVLIPRPETETLVDVALAWLEHSGRRGPEVLDMGTGSGCIAVALAHARPDARVTAVDAAEAVLEVARRNAQRYGLDNITFVRGRWFKPLGPRRFDLLAANPPYVPSDDPHLERGDVRFEPIAALDGGPDGLNALREIAAAAPHYLKPGACVMVEHGYDQAEAVATLFAAEDLVDIELHHDLAGRPRVTTARQPQ